MINSTTCQTNLDHLVNLKISEMIPMLSEYKELKQFIVEDFEEFLNEELEAEDIKKIFQDIEQYKGHFGHIL
ncbi:hypothetical protein B5M42_022610 [Paenibacillus athensensis]|uniref:hypothetical protein n=1 Tax=Paenibacillus athensensis TaxID=1967502 RepID=UPI0010704F73|nr:hypothetical protein [Paenibacillus athensensis]MCD1261599.1 hypothetical protein [Paenibacillus athensensis]